MKISILYYSGTGNTEAMAKAIAEGVSSKNIEVSLIPVEDAAASDISGSDAVALGCPSMGVEVLEESVFQPFYDEIKNLLSGKNVLLFGSYDWGDGEWMRTWADEVDSIANLSHEGLIAQNYPSDEKLKECHEAGVALANSLG